ncbi:MAG: hypothetical protein J6H18_03010 [Lachnospiraceae bacterium]|nr:hypothetical protein [Lachnospiraceae bacterium]
MSELVSFKCPSCGSPLKYSAEKQRFSCEYCGGDFSFDAVKDADVNASTEFDWGNYKENISGEKLEGTVSYVCKSCGAEIVTDATTAASLCPYCGSAVVMEENVSGVVKPNGIIPFRIDKKQLKDIVAKYCQGHPLLPRKFITDHKIESIQGMYVPFWLYDCHTDGTMGFNATRVRTWHDLRYNYTETSYYYVECEGEMAFSRVPVDGSFRMGDSLMDSLEPFDFSDIQDFAFGYLSGFVADRFDQDADTCLPRATARIRSSVSTAFTSAVRGGYATISPSRSNIALDQTKVSYVLLPVYFITTEFRGMKYEYAVNGQTGKMVGELPVDPRRANGYWLGIGAGVAAAALAVATFLL